MKNPDPTTSITELKSQIAAHVTLTGEIPKLETLLQKTSAELVELSAHCDLADEKALLKVARLQVLAGLLPLRIAALLESRRQSEKALIASAGNCVSVVISPKKGDVRRAAVQKVKKAIAPHFSNADQLEAAVNESDLVTSIEEIWIVLNASPDRPVDYARGVVADWEKLLQMEKTLGD